MVVGCSVTHTIDNGRWGWLLFCGVPSARWFWGVPCTPHCAALVRGYQNVVPSARGGRGERLGHALYRDCTWYTESTRSLRRRLILYYLCLWRAFGTLVLGWCLVPRTALRLYGVTRISCLRHEEASWFTTSVRGALRVRGGCGESLGHVLCRTCAWYIWCSIVVYCVALVSGVMSDFASVTMERTFPQLSCILRAESTLSS